MIILLVTRRYNSVLEEMQAKWAKKRYETLSEKVSENPVANSKKSLNSSNGSREG